MRVNTAWPLLAPIDKSLIFLKQVNRHRVLLMISFALSATATYAQKADEMPFGLAWRVIGTWHLDSEHGRISNGNTIEPGSLLHPAGEAGNHSITILLPDGQRVLYECFTLSDCTRGFRIPSLYRQPEPKALNLLARVSAVLLGKKASSPHPSQTEPYIARDESVTALAPGNTIEVDGLASALSNGSYSYEVRPLSRESLRQPLRTFEKRGRSMTFTVPSEGLFEIKIMDDLKKTRIDLLVAAVRPAHADGLMKSFQEIKDLLKDWNEKYQGWPIHDFQRDFLQSILLHISPTARTIAHGRAINAARDANVTDEPRFSPNPGVFAGDTAVSLHSDTAEATLYYTVDGSQPMKGSSIYHAPIMVKGTELTIKAFASAKGKKDSPVVTGIFRIGG